MEILKILGRKNELFTNDIYQNSAFLNEEVQKSSFLVIGGAGSIGKAITVELFKRNPKRLHIVDISENNLVELVRLIRSSLGYISGDFQTFALDCGSREFSALLNSEGPYDYFFNLSALKHVRSEKDPFTLMRMINVNIFNTKATIEQAINQNAKKYFSVSTDKATNPVNMMGASKKIMELFMSNLSEQIPISTARFANVAFSDGSLLYGFIQRIQAKQPISAPTDVKRYFITPRESGELCILSALLAKNNELFFPKLSKELTSTSFDKIAIRYLDYLGFEPVVFDSEEAARNNSGKLIHEKKWPCYFFKSDTTGEKDLEEFYTRDEKIELERFENIGVVNNNLNCKNKILDDFITNIEMLKDQGSWSKADLVKIFMGILPNFTHVELGKSLDEKM